MDAVKAAKHKNRASTGFEIVSQSQLRPPQLATIDALTSFDCQMIRAAACSAQGTRCSNASSPPALPSSSYYSSTKVKAAAGAGVQGAVIAINTRRSANFSGSSGGGGGCGDSDSDALAAENAKLKKQLLALKGEMEKSKILIKQLSADHS